MGLFREKFMRGLKAGRFERLTTEDLDAAVNACTAHNPLVPINRVDLMHVRYGIDTYFVELYNRPALQSLIDDDITYFPVCAGNEAALQRVKDALKDHPNALSAFPDEVAINGVKYALNKPHVFAPVTEFSCDNEDRERQDTWEQTLRTFQSMGAVRLDHKRKESLYTTPFFWSRACLHSWDVTGSVQNMRFRPLIGSAPDSYGYSEQDFRQLVEQVQTRTGRKNLNLLDVGGGTGDACLTAQQLYPSITATNLTLEDEIVMQPVDTVLAPAELMPVCFREKYGIILTNMAFCYMTIPALGLENCVHALAVGGTASLQVSTGHAPYAPNNYLQRLSEQYDCLRELEKSKCIELAITNEKERYSVKGKKSTEANVRITKLKSISPTA